jgi:hypothetical protein
MRYFPSKTGEPIRIIRKRFRQNFDGYVALELAIVPLIHLAHAACAYGRDNFIRPSLVRAD